MTWMQRHAASLLLFVSVAAAETALLLTKGVL